jgi:pSer/pThr/pTyr-binding forkhead associated (FHA) protein
MAAMVATSHVPMTGTSAEGITEQFDPISRMSSRDQQRALLAEDREPGRYLQVEGPDGSLLIPLNSGALRIGRGLTAEVCLDDTCISRRHAIITPHGAGYRILDDRSPNGTFVNGSRVEHADLRDRDVITLGRFDLAYLER